MALNRAASPLGMCIGMAVCWNMHRHIRETLDTLYGNNSANFRSRTVSQKLHFLLYEYKRRWLCMPVDVFLAPPLLPLFSLESPGNTADPSRSITHTEAIILLHHSQSILIHFIFSNEYIRISRLSSQEQRRHPSESSDMVTLQEVTVLSVDLSQFPHLLS